MAPTALEKAVHARDAAALNLDVIEQELINHATTPLLEAQVDLMLQSIQMARDELVDAQKKVFASAPPDIDVYKTEHLRLCRKSNQLHGAFMALKLTFPASAIPVVPAVGTDIRLPRLTLPIFDGRIEDWTPFRDMFQTAIHNNPKLSDAEKLTYLKGQLKGEAARQVQSLVITDANYSIAWRQLNDRYQNDRQLLFSLLKRFVQQQQISQATPTAIRQLVDTSQECIRSLQVLKQPVDQWDAMLLYILYQKLDVSSRELYEHGLKDKSVPHLQTLFDFLEQRSAALEAGSSCKPNSQFRSHEKQGFNNRTKPMVHFSKNSKCKFCSEHSHPYFKCSVFLGWTIQQRWDAAKKAKICFNCLGDHIISQCPSSKGCRECGAKHNSLLHKTKSDSNEVGNISASSSTSQPQTYHITCQDKPTPPSFDTLLATAVVQIQDNHGQMQLCRVFLDNGSNTHYITESCVRRLGIRREKFNTQSTGLGEVTVCSSSSFCSVLVCPRFSSTISYKIKPIIVKKITNRMPPVQHDPTQWSHLDDLLLADPQWYKPQKVDMLVGADVFFATLSNGKKTGPPEAPVAFSTTFGWVIGGGINSSDLHATSLRCVSQVKGPEALDNFMQKFWEIEDCPTTRILTKEEQTCESHFSSTYSRDQDGKFIVKLPFKSSNPSVGPSLNIAIKRFHCLERRLQFTPHRQEYIDFMKEYEDLGHMVETSAPCENNFNNKICYIPHHFVLKESSSTTKLRVVFDASAKTANGLSLNDQLMVGPTIQDNLIDIIIRFRLHNIVFTSDIAKMYRQIKVAPEDSDFQRIVWRETPSHPIKHYKLITVTYGTGPAPFLATRVLQELANSSKESFPLASCIAKRDFYVDDCISGAPTIQEALECQHQLIQMMNQGGFSLRKWSSNNQALLDSLHPELCETSSLLAFDENSTIKTLGIYWNPRQDKLQFKIAQLQEKFPATKRSILSAIAKLFDPVGWLAPVIIRAKILMQNIWQEKVDWDDHPSETIQHQWADFQTGLCRLENINISRCFFAGSEIVCPSLNQICTPKIHFHLAGFSDASQHAYSAVIYICAYEGRHSSVALVTSKTRVAPVKTISIPRLELCGALLLADLMTSVRTALVMPIRSVSAWTDSTIVLDWLNSEPSRWNVFVANRVTKIQNQLASNAWGHVKSDENPADCASRGLSSEELINHKLWWNGPLWLRKSVPEPKPHVEDSSHQKLEEKSNLITFSAHTKPNHTLSLLEKHSSLSRLLRITSYVLRFINRRRKLIFPILSVSSRSGERESNPVEVSGVGHASNGRCGLDVDRKCSKKESGPITPRELDESLIIWVKLVQRYHFCRELSTLKERNSVHSKSPLLNLHPFLDENEIIRVGGRLRNSELSPDRKFPIIIPRNSHLTKLILSHEHLSNFHAGPQLMLSIIQRKYWIIRAKDAIRFHIRKCVTCTRSKAETLQQIMADLPAFRVTPARAFVKCGVDYAGPFLLRSIVAKSKTTIKCYLAVFVCCVTRAIHIEVVSALSTEMFLAALRRFVARRGRPTDIYSDCGTNFVGANKQLKELLSLVLSSSHNDAVANDLAKVGTSWHFNPPSAPHFGGLWEAGVKSIKHHLLKILGNQRWTFEMMTTATTQIEAILNSRPLTPVSSDPNDLGALTPGHFLIGGPVTSIPEPTFNEIPTNRLSLWQQIQQSTQRFWTRWSSEYLTRLQQRPKWMTPHRSIQVGDLVTIKDENLPPLQWRLGRVLELHPGPSSIVRVVTVKTASGHVKRPIAKLCLLPIDP